jgi:uncharacterized protein
MSGATTGGPSLTQRDSKIDALRGFNLLGIAIVNTPWIGLNPALPDLLWNDARRAALPLHDVLSAGLVEGLFEGKFYPQFAMLFGLGTAKLIARDKAAYARRIAVLFAFGLLHSLFGWWGDILLNYAFLGVILFALNYLPPRAILASSLLLLVGTTVLSIFVDTWMAPEAAPTAEELAEHAAYLARNTAIYRDGSFLDVSWHRYEELLSFFGPYNWTYRLNTVVMGAFGLWLERSGSVSRLLVSAKHGLIALALVAAGLLLSASLLLYVGHYIVASNVLALGYAASFLWLMRRDAFGRIRLFCTGIGQMAITAYLGQTLVFTLFFYGYGLGMYGSVGPTFALTFATSVWCVEALLCHLWMKHFQLGPVEWLWRSLTYMRALPLRRAASND